MRRTMRVKSRTDWKAKRHEMNWESKKLDRLEGLRWIWGVKGTDWKAKGHETDWESEEPGRLGGKGT